MPQISVINGNAILLALQYFNDATEFVNIMQTNQLNDWVINGPIIALTQSPNNVGDTVLVLQPTDGIQIGSLVYCDGLDTFGYVLNVQNIYSQQTGLPFASCPPLAPAPQRILPPSGTWVSTNVTISPGLDNAMVTATGITFAAATQQTITIPAQPSKTRGTPQ